MKEKVVLAFSGGLDTSFCVKYLNEEKGLDVYSAIANTGGFTEDELAQVSDRAYALGVSSHISLDIVNEYYNDYIRFMIYGNILKNGTYPLSVSSERTVQALAIAKYAKSIGAKYIAHGSTGAGNDQVRFDLVFSIMVPEIEIITPIRDLSLSREAEITYLKERGVEADWTKMAYSINKGLWGTSVGGKETLTSNLSLPENAYPSHLEKEGEEIITLGFVNGEVVEVNGVHFINPVDAIHEIDKLASVYAIGRDMHVGDTIIGIKGRVGFEAPSPMVIIKAHHTLEKHVLTKWQQYWKEQLSTWYGMLLHEGQYLDPVMRNIEKFLVDTQETVTGKVFVKLMPYRFNVEGIESKYDLMNAGSGLYGEMSGGWSGDDVKGFTKLLGNQLKIYQSVKDKNSHKSV
jgi:argininosuccinate synthase